MDHIVRFKGQEICHQHDPSDAFYVVVKGSAVVTVNVEEKAVKLHAETGEIKIDDMDDTSKGRADPALAPSNMGHEITKVLKGREKCCQYRHQEDGNQYICNNSWVSKEMTTCLYHKVVVYVLLVCDQVQIWMLQV